MQSPWFRRWIWVAIVVQFSGYVFDALWHSLLRQGVEPKTLSEMTGHLLTVHLLLYVGAIGLVVTTGLALLDDARRSAPRVAADLVAPQVAFAAAVLSVTGEIGHAVLHLNLNTEHAPIPALVSVVGFLVVVVTMVVCAIRRRRMARETLRGLGRAA